jgi:hypothetical protein
MNKKDYIIKLLEKISDNSEISKLIEIILKNKELDNSDLEFIFDFLREKLNDFFKKDIENNGRNLLNILKKIQEEENLEKNKDIEKDFLNLMNNL